MKEEFSEYANKSINELKLIQPKWAFGKNHRKAMYTQDFLNVRHTIYYAKLYQIVEHLEFGEVQMHQLFTGESINDTRVARILNRWNNHEFVDPPNIYVPKRSNLIYFGNGRHRTKTAYLLGQEQIPLIIPDEDVYLIKEVLQLSKKPF